ncbi:vWA domain-containing protein [Chitinimonas koreensis]|uniref:vWA domain-containing protein n=1 Tax=Chitinimonas koreensis TaxID=356302 RepID=UPI0003FD2ED4|nr:VWA domain-containing protein [Chitinimonas koreensis]QNM98319.1 VWA domain-containing protein [Chitinimonas koreensis]
MLLDFFYQLRAARLPVSIKEFLTLLEALDARVVAGSLDDFYVLARTVLVKDEKYFDRFDQVFGHYFKGAEHALEKIEAEIPEDWLTKLIEKQLSEEEKAQLKGMGWDKLMQTLKERLAEQKERHQGGNTWIGTGGTSPFGAYGYNPEGIRIGQDGSRHRRAVKVWDQREYRDFDDTRELGSRNFKVALRRLRRFARDAEANVLDLDGTVRATSDNAGWLELKFRHERHNAVKVLLLLDVGGSMDDHIQVCETLFSAARSEFKHLEQAYFHNFVYESVWRDNRRRHAERLPTWDLLHTYPSDYKLILVGDATMSPYEISYPGGSVEHMNEEPGRVWLERLLARFPAAVWLNPVDEQYWDYTESLRMTRELMGGRMFPLTPAGLESAMRRLMAAQ